MNRIAVFLRRQRTNKFRAAILNTLRLSAVDEALLCSGFFQEDRLYPAGADFGLLRHRSCSALTLTPLGLYDYGKWSRQYRDFVVALRVANPCSCVTVVPKRIRGMKWHAKVFIAKRKSAPAVAVIGSSNITRRAFGEFDPFNRECDVVMWDENDQAVAQAIDAAIGDDLAGDIDNGVFVANYDADHRSNRRPLRERIASLEAEILGMAVDL